MSEEPRKPAWTPEDAGEAYAARILRGVAGNQRDPAGADEAAPARVPRLSTAEYVAGVRDGDRAVLARAITLVESNARHHFEQAQAVLQQLLPDSGAALRVGITGVPGAGKSTLIEALGLQLVAQGHRVAVLAVDPTSSVSRGSILGDKTRMGQLSQHPAAFIRPSPTGGMLGGVARKTRETMLVCEAAGFDVILVETVGTGQSEIAVRAMVDFFLLLLVPGSGDELQGIKKGVVELADAILINKADGANQAPAAAARAEYDRALRYLTPATEGWRTRAYTGSALTGAGVAEIWGVIEAFLQQTRAAGVWERRRQAQRVDWLHTLVEEQLRDAFYGQPAVATLRPQLEAEVRAGTLSATVAARRLLQLLAQD